MSGSVQGGTHTPLWRRVPERIGGMISGAIANLGQGVARFGGVLNLLGSVVERIIRAMTIHGGRISRDALFFQMIRVGVRAIPIIIVVQMFIGAILGLNLAPTLESYGQLESIADVIGIAVVRELGPLITGIVLSGFAGASIAAELGTMVEGEEIKALRASALDPVRFLIVPRVIATMVMMVGLTVLSDVVGCIGGLITSYAVLGVSVQTYIDHTQAILTTTDYITGLFKAGVFGVIIAGLACYEGINVRGGAEGVGRATTATVVKSIVALIAADSCFALVFYRMGW